MQNDYPAKQKQSNKSLTKTLWRYPGIKINKDIIPLKIAYNKKALIGFIDTNKFNKEPRVELMIIKESKKPKNF